MPQFRKKPIVIEAVQYTGENFAEIEAFGAKPYLIAGDEPTEESWDMVIPTLEGVHIASVGDWIIKGVKHEFYPCKPDIFTATYDAVE